MTHPPVIEVETILDRISDAVFSLDSEWRFVYLNDAAEGLLRSTADELLAERIWERYPETATAEFRSTFHTAMERQEHFSVELYYEPWDLWVEEHLYPSPEGLTVVAHDITDRKDRDRQIDSLHELLRSFLTADTRDHVAEIAVESAAEILDLEANSVHFYEPEVDGLVPVAMTEDLETLIGDPPTLTPGDSIAWRVYEQGDITAIDDVHTDPDVKNPDTDVRSELYLPLDRHGILLAGSASAASFDQEDRTLGGILARNVVTALDQLEQRRQLRDREQELLRQNARLEEFADIVAHDLRNPLNVAEGRVEMARDAPAGPHLDVVDSALDRMRSLIDEMLTLARLGATISETESFEITPTIETCWRNVSTSQATLSIDCDGTIEADRKRFQQLVENLFRNAIEHGGEDVTVTVGTLGDGVYIEDDGPGIPAEDRADVFDHGFSTSAGGTGLGLNIVGQVVDAHGWAIDVSESSEGGARFEITGCEIEP